MPTPPITVNSHWQHKKTADEVIVTRVTIFRDPVVHIAGCSDYHSISLRRINLSVICLYCRQKGHVGSDCPSRRAELLDFLKRNKEAGERKRKDDQRKAAMHVTSEIDKDT